MIDELLKLASEEIEPSVLSQILASIHQQAVGFMYTATEPTASTTPYGKFVVYDDGSTKRLYLKTGKDNLAYVDLT